MPTRRSCLGALVGGLSALAGCGSIRPWESDEATPTPGGPRSPSGDPRDAQTADAPTGVVPESSFERVVNVVDDVGVDATGETPIDDAFEEALADDTLLRFPEGTYKFERSHTVTDVDRVGIAGRGDVTFVPNASWNGKLFDVKDVDAFLLGGVDVDLTRENTTAGLKLRCREAFRVADVEFLGRGTHRDEHVFHALNAAVVNADGQGLVRNLVAKRGSAVDRYKNGNGRGGIYVGPWNEGTITVQNCHLSEFGNNGIYASRTPGDVRVLGGTFRNNSPSSVRIGGRGSRVEGALVEVDPSTYEGPSFDGSRSKLRGVVVEQKTKQRDILKPAGAVVRDCRIRFGDNPTKGPPVVVWSNGKTLSIENCRIHVENDTPAVLREGLVDQGSNPPWRGERWVRVSDTRITGSQATDCAAMRLIDAPDSTVRGSRISRSGTGCTGVELVRSPGATIEGGSIETSSYPVLLGLGDGGDECLLAFRDGPSLEMTGSNADGPVRRRAAICADADGSSTADGASDPCCFTAAALSGEAGERPAEVGIVRTGDRDVSFQLL